MFRHALERDEINASPTSGLRLPNNIGRRERAASPSAASDNAASIRVLTKCGFRVVGEGRGFAHGRNEETDEVVLRLDA